MLEKDFWRETFDFEDFSSLIHLWQKEPEAKVLKEIISHIPAMATQQSIAAANSLMWQIRVEISSSTKMQNSQHKHELTNLIAESHYKVSDSLYEVVRSDKITPADKADYVVILIAQFLNIQHAPTRVVLDMTRQIKEKDGLKSFIIVTNTMETRGDWPFINNFAANKLNIAGWKKFTELEPHGNPAIYFAPDNGIEPTKVQSLMDEISKLTPRAFISISGNNPIAEIINKHTPVILSPTVIGGSASRSPVMLDIYNQQGSHRIDGTTERVIKAVPYILPVALPERIASFTRSDFDLPDDALVYAIPGNRLESEVSENFETRLAGMMSENKNIWLFFIGGHDSGYQPTSLELLAQRDRIKSIPSTKHLAETLAVADAVIDTPSPGNGTCGFVALLEGKPAFGLGYLDVAQIFGAPEMPEDMNALFSLLLRFSVDENEQKKWQNRVKVWQETKSLQFLDKNSDRNSIAPAIAETENL